MKSPFRKITSVKPVSNSPLFNEQWVIVQGSVFKQAVDDYKRFGFRVALHNFLIEIGLKEI